MAVREKNLDKAIVKLVRSRGGYAAKNHGSKYGRRGRPDIDVCYKGLWISFESKAGDNDTDGLQDIEIKKIKNAGGIALAVWDIATVRRVLDTIDLHFEVVKIPFEI